MMRSLLALLLTCAITAPALAQDASPSPAFNEELVPQVMENAVSDFIVPGYRDFHKSADKLVATMDGLCAEPFPKNLDAARHAFASTVEAWSKIEIVRTGPVIEQNRFERILFYPDRKSTGLKQVQAALATKDESATTADSLEHKSVAMQGLGALEFILYGTGNEELLDARDTYRCRYGMAVSANLRNLAGELLEAWEQPDGIRQAWTHPGPDNPSFRTNSEALTALLGILVHGAETVRDQRIETFYKGEDARTFPHQAIYRRAGLTFKSINDNIAGLDGLLERSDMVQLLDPDKQSIVASIKSVSKDLTRKTASLDAEVNADVEKAVKDKEARAKLDYLLVNSKDLILRLNNDYGGAVGLGAGFSFADGD